MEKYTPHIMVEVGNELVNNDLSYIYSHYGLFWTNHTNIKITFNKYISDKTVLFIVGNVNGTILLSIISDHKQLDLGNLKPTYKIDRANNTCTISGLKLYGTYMIFTYDSITKMEQY